MSNTKIVDLSVLFDPDAMEPEKVTFERTFHKEGAEKAAPLLGLEVTDFPESQIWAYGKVTLSEHTGTHLDAPIHYAPTSEGKPAKSID